jgi:hypothetical protein
MLVWHFINRLKILMPSVKKRRWKKTNATRMCYIPNMAKYTSGEGYNGGRLVLSVGGKDGGSSRSIWSLPCCCSPIPPPPFQIHNTRTKRCDRAVDNSPKNHLSWQDFRGFLQSFQTNAGRAAYFKLGHDSFLQYPFQFIYHSTPHSMSYWQSH